MKMGSLVGSPRASAGSPEAKVASFQDKIQPHPGIAVIVIVGLPDVAEGIQRQLVRITKVVGKNAEIRSVRIDSQDRARIVGTLL